MSGFSDIVRLRRIEKEVNELGFVLANPKNGYYQNQWGDAVALVPKDANSLPVYSRDAEVFVGTLEQLNIWLSGVEWARQYDMLIKLSNDKKRTRKEQDVRNQQMVAMLKNEPIERRKK